MPIRSSNRQTIKPVDSIPPVQETPESFRRYRFTYPLKPDHHSHQLQKHQLHRREHHQQRDQATTTIKIVFARFTPAWPLAIAHGALTSNTACGIFSGAALRIAPIQSSREEVAG
ncbi:hypothetical protein Mal52_27820 [Symmachiella dynata]|uniref:Uncharacterized protein n=1 Tax=Symmachiella dynata TaxID=2527995 RepID=A0A517ZP97_9PLAN|nr:hypothetical protein Mal52_27820 [Symmachiella dynata]